MRRFDEGDGRLRRLIQLYRGSIAAVKDNLVVSRLQERKVFRIRFERLMLKIEQWSADEPEIDDSLVSFIAILTDYRLSEEQEFAEQQQQLRKTVASLSSLVETIRQNHGEHGRELENVTLALEKALFEPDVHRIHDTVQQQIRSLKSSMVAISELSFDTSKLIAHDIVGLERLANPQQDDSEIPGLWQGADHEAAFQDYMDHYELFCVLSVEIGGLDDVQRGLGFPALKQIHAEFEKRVQRACADTKTKQVWREGRVFIILNQAGEQASHRQAKLRISLTQPYSLSSRFGTAEFRLPPRVGIAEYNRGESLEDLMRRLEENAAGQQLIAV
jgi:hypothetical protein